MNYSSYFLWTAKLTVGIVEGTNWIVLAFYMKLAVSIFVKTYEFLDVISTVFYLVFDLIVAIVGFNK